MLLLSRSLCKASEHRKQYSTSCRHVQYTRWMALRESSSTGVSACMWWMWTMNCISTVNLGHHHHHHHHLLPCKPHAKTVLASELSTMSTYISSSTTTNSSSSSNHTRRKKTKNKFLRRSLVFFVEDKEATMKNTWNTYVSLDLKSRP